MKSKIDLMFPIEVWVELNLNNFEQTINKKAKYFLVENDRKECKIYPFLKKKDVKSFINSFELKNDLNSVKIIQNKNELKALASEANGLSLNLCNAIFTCQNKL